MRARRRHGNPIEGSVRRGRRLARSPRLQRRIQARHQRLRDHFAPQTTSPALVPLANGDMFMPWSREADDRRDEARREESAVRQRETVFLAALDERNREVVDQANRLTMRQAIDRRRDTPTPVFVASAAVFGRPPDGVEPPRCLDVQALVCAPRPGPAAGIAPAA